MLNKVFSFVLSLIMLLTGAGGVPTYEPLDESAVKLSFVACADTHMESDNAQRYKDFAAALKDMSGAARRNDALVICGDVTMNGQMIEYMALSAMLGLYNDSRNTLLAMGNHEIFTQENGFEKGSAKFIRYSKSISGNTTGKTYYYDVINNYYFIILGSEADMGVNAYISDEQLKWLDDTLAAAAKGGNPAFVFCHFPLEGTTNNAWPAGLMGEQSDAVYDILQKYEKVFYFSGHLHNAVDYSGVNTIGNVTFVDLPTLISGAVTHGIYETGVAYQVEVYADRVELRPRSYSASGHWFEDLSVTVTL